MTQRKSKIARFRIIALFCIAMIVVGCTQQNGNITNPKQIPLSIASRIDLSTEYQVYRYDEKIPLKIRLQNVGDTDIGIWQERPMVMFEFAIKDLMGMDVPMTKEGKRQFGGVTSRRESTLEPGASKLVEIEMLNRFFDMTRSGRYTIQGSAFIENHGENTTERSVSKVIEVVIHDFESRAAFHQSPKDADSKPELDVFGEPFGRPYEAKDVKPKARESYLDYQFEIQINTNNSSEPDNEE